MIDQRIDERNNYIVWTEFFDNASGGHEKTEYFVIYIPLPKDEAVEYFKKRFGLDPYDTECDCCGVNYSINEVPAPKQRDSIPTLIIDIL
ncbi:MAG TPA: hypothetical protein VNX68_12270 [Nitrosopumilaceae archaeon]|nr:hypothetical protein [Nitrosopumilaceae archaeon]